MNTGIYQITNCANGKRYVGSASNIRSRWSRHRKDLERGTHPNKKLQNSWTKYGAAYFAFSRILVCDKSNLILYEQRAIDILNPEYNILRIAGSTLGAIVSEDVKRRISAAHKGRRHTPETRAKMSEHAKNITPEHRAKLSEAARGRTVPASTRIKISAFFSGKIRGPHSDETKAKISARHKGRKFSEEHKAKLRASHRSRKVDQEVIDI